MMMMKTGTERFRHTGSSLDLSLLDYWRWAGSSLLDNTSRGMLAEFIVATALSVADTPRTEWLPYDLTTSSGVKVEVKNAAYVQSWAQKQPSRISFNIRAARAWSPDTGESATAMKRHADVYVFCLLIHQDRATLNPLDLNQWEFYVLRRKVLDERCAMQKSIGLDGLRSLGAKSVRFADLRTSIEETVSDG